MHLLEREKKRSLKLPEETVLKLNKLYRKVKAIRFEYDEVKLSPVNRETLSKLDIKIIIRDRDMEIKVAVKKDLKLYKIWGLSNLNSNIIPPTILLRLKREARLTAS